MLHVSETFHQNETTIILIKIYIIDKKNIPNQNREKTVSINGNSFPTARTSIIDRKSAIALYRETAVVRRARENSLP